MKRKVGNRLTQISWRNGTSEEIRQRRGKERKKREEIGRGGKGGNGDSSNEFCDRIREGSA